MSIPFSQPMIHEDAYLAIKEVVDGGWLTSAKKCLEFEKVLNEYLQVPDNVVVNSATAGLHLALASLELQPEDEVIVPSYTFAATAEVVGYVRAKTVFADVGENYNIRVEDIAQVVTENTKVVMVVHMAGYPCDMDAILAYCNERDIKVIEDAAHAFGSLYKGKTIGSLDSYATVFSFYANKCITTGEGGSITSPSSELLARLRKLRLHGITRDVTARFTDTKALPTYDIDEVGYKYNLTDICAAIGISQVAHADEMLKSRREAVMLYYRYLSPLAEKGWISLPHLLDGLDEGTESSYHLFMIQVLGGKRDALAAHLREQEIGTSIHYTPVPMLTAYNHLPAVSKNAIKLFENELTLPLFSGMTASQVTTVCMKIWTFLGLSMATTTL